MSSLLKVGDVAPAFDVTSSDGKRIRLEDFRGKKNVVLYFYPKDETSVCSKEACGFRDMYEDLVAADTEVVGVSPDSDESHLKFAKRLHVTFPLISDPKKELADRYGATGGVLSILGMLKRVTYVIDTNGRIVKVVQNAISADAHFDAVNDALAHLKGVSALSV